jgi:gamma-glutamyl-gamma-aminobutyrate hydrolase PuuD
MNQFGGSLKQVMAFFPDQTAQEVQQHWTFIRHQNGDSSRQVQRTIRTEEVRTIEQIPQEREQPEPDSFHFEETATFDSGEDCWEPMIGRNDI